MRKYFGLIVLFLGFCSVNAVGAERSPIVIGDKLQFSSKILGENRSLNIYLPSSYTKMEDKKYPVIYLLDGSMGEDFIHIAGLVQFGSFPWINMLSESILVGIANVDRKRDFTFPSKVARDRKEFPSSGGSEKFIEALEKEIRPLIESEYRVNGESTLIGQSLGGLLATEILFKRAGLFNHYIIISPSLWWSGESLLTDLPEDCCDAKSVYIGVGKEGEVMERLANRLFSKLNTEKNKGEVHFGYFEELGHGDTLHLAVYDAFDRIFSAGRVENKSEN
ncbi:alpha/beta hydrolase [Microbulbifer epialgicus]|uniref:Alpha/beta hydrolase n=1 Tax=Microbulbifer epialgicus TaxID=393907 RepID=A0ABV4P3H7_9GAMM